MICFFPHTYISTSRLRSLCECFPRLSIFQTSEKYVGDSMRQLVDQRRLDIRFPRHLKSERLEAMFDAFSAWAGMHPKGLGDLKHFFRLHQNRPPLVEETHPTQIQSQIRRFGQGGDGSQNDTYLSGDLQLQAALFLSLAHCFDEHQDTLSSDLGTIGQMEARMFAELSGDEAIETISSVLQKGLLKAIPENAAEASRAGESGKYLVAERIRAWATLAADDPEPAWAYITTNLDVAEAVLDIFPESVGLTHWNLGRSEDPEKKRTWRPSDLFATMEEFAFSRTFPVPEKSPVHAVGSIDPADTNVRFLLFGVPHCSPRQALAGLINGKPGYETSPSSQPEAENTLFGLMTGV
jgi:hypothetical protein